MSWVYQPISVPTAAAGAGWGHLLSQVRNRLILAYCMVMQVAIRVVL